MLKVAIFPGRYIQGYGALAELESQISKYGGKAFVIVDQHVRDHVLGSRIEEMKSGINAVVESFGGECSRSEIDRLKGSLGDWAADVIVGIGGGKTLDAAKMIAVDLGLPMVLCPTIASTDAPTSATSVIYTVGGEVEEIVRHRTPDVVIVDTQIIVQAPVRFLVSGMGDAVSTWFEADSTRRSYGVNEEGYRGLQTAYSIAWDCYETIRTYAKTAKEAAHAGAVTAAFERVVEANTLMSGLGFESGGLGAAHAIHNGLTVLEEAHGCYHGEKVAFGVLASLFLTDKSVEVVDEVYSLFLDIGLPVCFKDLGVKEVSEDKLSAVAQRSCADGESIRNECFLVQPHDVVEALKHADREGVARKAMRQ